MLSSGYSYSICFLGGKSWLTKRNVGIHRARASRNRAENTAALRAKAQVRRSNLIAIAVTKSVRGIFRRASYEKAQKAQKDKRLAVREAFCAFCAFLWLDIF